MADLSGTSEFVGFWPKCCWMRESFVFVTLLLVIAVSSESNVCLNLVENNRYSVFTQECGIINKSSNSGPLIPCVNIKHLSADSASRYSYLGRTKVVNDLELWDVLYNNTVKSFCALVFFFAADCPFSAKAASKFNALGRVYHAFPVLAIDVIEHSRATRDYIIAYYPSIVLYYDGKVAKRFDPSSTFKSLCKRISDITGIVIDEDVLVTPDDFQGPLLTEPVPDTDWILLFSLLYIIVVSVYLILKHVL